MNDYMKTVDKSNFKCFQMADQSVFYGDTVHLHPETQQLYYSIEKDETVEESVKAKLRMVRHGWGIQLFGTSEQGVLVCYAGQFQRDKKHGQGKFTFPDGAVYEGNFIEDKFQDHGVYKFSDGRVFKGNWKAGKIEGGGELTYPVQDPNGELAVLKGAFKNNLFAQATVNPSR